MVASSVNLRFPHGWRAHQPLTMRAPSSRSFLSSDGCEIPSMMGHVAAGHITRTGRTLHSSRVVLKLLLSTQLFIMFLLQYAFHRQPVGTANKTFCSLNKKARPKRRREGRTILRPAMAERKGGAKREKKKTKNWKNAFMNLYDGGFLSFMLVSWRIGNALDAKLGVIFVSLLLLGTVDLMVLSCFWFLFPLLPFYVLHGWMALLYLHAALLTRFPATKKWQWQLCCGFSWEGFGEKSWVVEQNKKGNGRYTKSLRSFSFYFDFFILQEWL
ncbi:hypothetical protein V8C42DRAFT_117061 [Trichoderma barbatum]